MIIKELPELFTRLPVKWDGAPIKWGKWRTELEQMPRPFICSIVEKGESEQLPEICDICNTSNFPRLSIEGFYEEKHVIIEMRSRARYVANSGESRLVLERCLVCGGTTVLD